MLELTCKIETWASYKKTVELREVRDSTKGWIRMVVEPTMRHNGFTCLTANDIDGDTRKPNTILKEDFADIIKKSNHVVYHVTVPTGSYAGYYKYLEVFYK
jgi:hypothetical protein